MDFFLFAKGIFAGFVIAAPVGPVGILCVQRTLDRGLVAGFLAGSGAAVADTIFGAAAAFGLTFVAAFIQENYDYMRWLGGAFLLLIGLHTIFFKRVKASDEAQIPRSRTRALNAGFSDMITTFVLTISNPITIVSFSPVFLAVGAVVGPDDLYAAWTLIIGVFAGSALWWLILCCFAALFRRKLSDQRMGIVNKVSGGLIMVFGILVLAGVTDIGKRIANATGL